MRAYLEGVPPTPATPEGEQYSVAALTYLLMTGTHWQDFRLDRQGMYQDILEKQVLSFAERGAASWPALESVLARALSKHPSDRFPSVVDFADALGALPAEPRAQPSAPPQTSPRLEQLLRHTKALAVIGGPWITGERPSAPFASLTYGSCGVALGLLCIAHREGDALGLSTADVWACRSAREIDRDGAFYNPDFEITAETVGRGSPYHSASGIHATTALIARAAADTYTQWEATSKFIEAAGQPVAGLDLTVGKASTILASAILLDAASG